MEEIPNFLSTLIEYVSTWGLRVVGAIVILVLGRMVAGWVKNALVKSLAKTKVDQTLVPFISGMAYYLVIAFVVIAVMGLFGIPTASFVAVLGAAGLAVGLAIQGTLSNFAAGVMLLLLRPFRVGDLVETGGELGVIEEIGIFSTTMSSLDNIRIILPNSKVYGEKVRNYTGNETRRVDLVIGISYSDDIGRAIEIIQKTIADEPLALREPEPTVAVSNLGDSSVDLVVRPWCKTADYWTVYFNLTRHIKENLEAAGCTIPFPQHDVHLFNDAA